MFILAFVILSTYLTFVYVQQLRYFLGYFIRGIFAHTPTDSKLFTPTHSERACRAELFSSTPLVQIMRYCSLVPDSMSSSSSTLKLVPSLEAPPVDIQITVNTHFFCSLIISLHSERMRIFSSENFTPTNGSFRSASRALSPIIVTRHRRTGPSPLKLV